MTSLDSIQDKWYRKTKRRVESAINRLTESATFDDYVEALAAIDGMPPERAIRESDAADAWREEVGKIDANEVMDAIEKAYERNKWKDNFARAFE